MGKVTTSVAQCGNVRCSRGPKFGRAIFRKRKPWAKFCSRECGDTVRSLRHYHKTKGQGNA